MKNVNEKPIETIETIENRMQPDPKSAELEEELSELDVEKVAGGCCYTRPPTAPH